MKCPRCHQEPAIIDRTYGVLPCQSCQKKDEQYSIRGCSEQHGVNKYHRIQAQRDKHLKDMEQPYLSDKPNPEFFKANKDRVEEYGVHKYLEKI